MIVVIVDPGSQRAEGVLVNTPLAATRYSRPPGVSQAPLAYCTARHGRAARVGSWRSGATLRVGDVRVASAHQRHPRLQARAQVRQRLAMLRCDRVGVRAVGLSGRSSTAQHAAGGVDAAIAAWSSQGR
jgi:hypothetical protein